MANMTATGFLGGPSGPSGGPYDKYGLYGPYGPDGLYTVFPHIVSGETILF